MKLKQWTSYLNVFNGKIDGMIDIDHNQAKNFVQQNQEEDLHLKFQ